MPVPMVRTLPQQNFGRTLQLLYLQSVLRFWGPSGEWGTEGPVDFWLETEKLWRGVLCAL